jgi:hypothetical protein
MAVTISPLKSPNTCPGAYELHLYCKYKNPDHDFDEFPHIPSQCQTRGEAVGAMRRIGWVLHRDGTATCPKCNKALKG